MSGPLLLDTDILALLAVGTASRDHIATHRRTAEDFSADDFDLVTGLMKSFSEVVLIPHVFAETSNLVRQIGNPRRAAIQRALAGWVSLVLELPIASLDGVAREEHLDLGITDALLLHLCGLRFAGAAPTLLTIDGPLADRAASLGYGVIGYRREFQGR